MTQDADRTPDSRSRIEIFWLSGSLLLYGGVGLLIVAGMDRASTIPFPLPDFWYPNRVFWPFLAIVAIASGLGMLRHESQPTWQPGRPGRRFSSVVLYTRDGCHLCDDVRYLLRAYSRWIPAAIEVDIDDDPELQERFDTCVPVVEFDGKVRFRGRVDVTLLRRLIEGEPPIS
jgi:glutaredoxin